MTLGILSRVEGQVHHEAEFCWSIADLRRGTVFLNVRFHLHISIIGSVLLTIGLSAVFSFFRR